MIWTDQQINELAEECLNLVCERVQNRIGQPYGDWASLYHSDGLLLGQIDDYIRYEMEHAKTPTEWGFNDFVKTRTFYPDGSKVEAIECEYANNPVLVYDECYFIEILKDGQYFLVIENQQYTDKDLEKLERILYKWWESDRI